jgi:NAD(P)-dependent dehydrogenase (short-subunit alcohol dehydrogenase family)
MMANVPGITGMRIAVQTLCGIRRKKNLTPPRRETHPARMRSTTNDTTSAVVITGTSSGIGYGTAKVLLAKGYRVYGTVRNAEDAERVRTELGEQFVSLIADVTDEESLQRAADLVRGDIGQNNLAGLVNNAGVLLPAPLYNQSRKDFEAHLSVNVTGVLLTTQAFLPLLGAEAGRTGKPGRVINVSSVAGKIASPFIGAYAASKHALEGMSDSMRREFMLFGIDVIVVGPGSTVTPIWDKAEAAAPEAKGPYAVALGNLAETAKEMAKLGFPPERAGEAIFRALTVRKPKVRYEVMPYRLLFWTLPLMLPPRWYDSMLARAFKVRPSDRAT